MSLTSETKQYRYCIIITTHLLYMNNYWYTQDDAYQNDDINIYGFPHNHQW